MLLVAGVALSGLSLHVALGAPRIDHALLRYGTSTSQHYAYRQTPSGGLVISAPSGTTDTNIREVFWNPASQSAQDESECVTFKQSAATFSQEGLALRVAWHGHYLELLTLTKNVWWGKYWVFNVSRWTTGPNGVTTYKKLGYFDESAVVGGKNGARYAPLPWSMCAQVVGRTFSALVWPASHTAPPWSAAKSLTLPAKWVFRGRVGLFAGHLWAGDSITYGAPTPQPPPGNS